MKTCFFNYVFLFIMRSSCDNNLSNVYELSKTCI